MNGRIKYLYLPLMIGMQFSCQLVENKRAIVAEAIQEASKEHQDSIFAGHPISFYIAHQGIPQGCKDIFKSIRKPADDPEGLALLDSILTSNDETRPFYFLTVTRTMEKADGAFAEPLGMVARQFVETRTKEFVNYFRNGSLLTEQDFGEWAETVAGEIKISAEGNEKTELANLNSKLRLNCNGCFESQTRIIDEFIERTSRSLN